MKNTIVFKENEYKKLIETLGLLDNQPDEKECVDYFNAWNFGQSEKDYQFIIGCSLND